MNMNMNIVTNQNFIPRNLFFIKNSRSRYLGVNNVIIAFKDKNTCTSVLPYIGNHNKVFNSSYIPSTSRY